MHSYYNFLFNTQHVYLSIKDSNLSPIKAQIKAQIKAKPHPVTDLW